MCLQHYAPHPAVTQERDPTVPNPCTNHSLLSTLPAVRHADRNHRPDRQSVVASPRMRTSNSQRRDQRRHSQDRASGPFVRGCHRQHPQSANAREPQSVAQRATTVRPTALAYGPGAAYLDRPCITARSLHWSRGSVAGSRVFGACGSRSRMYWIIWLQE